MSNSAATVDVAIPVEPAIAVALADARTRAAMGRLLSRVLRPRSGPSELGLAITEAKAEARAAGLTDADIDAELDVYNAERRSPPCSVIVFDASAVISAALRESSVPGQALLHAEETDIFALSDPVDAEIAAVITTGPASRRPSPRPVECGSWMRCAGMPLGSCRPSR